MQLLAGQLLIKIYLLLEEVSAAPKKGTLVLYSVKLQTLRRQKLHAALRAGITHRAKEHILGASRSGLSAVLASATPCNQLATQASHLSGTSSIRLIKTACTTS